jgi:cytochrome c peroxidase
LTGILYYVIIATNGELAEWSNAPDLKSDELKGSVGSNPTLSAICLYYCLYCEYIMKNLMLVTVTSVLLSACGGGTEMPEFIEVPSTTTPPAQTPVQIESAKLRELIIVSDLVLPMSDDYSNIPQDVMNPITEEKVKLGKLLFHETAMTLGASEDHEATFSCASCHNARSGFKSGIAQGVGEGGVGNGSNRVNVLGALADVQPLASPTAMNTAYQEVMLWNGQFGNAVDGIVNIGVDESILSTPNTPKENNARQWSGLETQAVAGLGVHRLNVGDDSLLTTLPEYQELVMEIGGDDLLVTAAQSIAAFERTILSNEAPFQKWLRGDEDALSETELKGAQVFFGKGDCAGCHQGPALSSPQYATKEQMFMAVGFSDLDVNDNIANADAINDAVRKGRGGFTQDEFEDYQFKIPPLYNLTDSNFMGHGASFTSVREVVEYKNAGVAQADIPEGKLDYRFRPLGLTAEEIDQLVTFIEVSLYDDNLSRYVPTSLPSGQCVENHPDC